MAEHPLFEKLMTRLDEIEARMQTFEDALGEQGMNIQRAEMAVSSMEREANAIFSGVDQLFDDFHALAEDSRRREWHAMLPEAARENIRKAS